MSTFQKRLCISIPICLAACDITNSILMTSKWHDRNEISLGHWVDVYITFTAGKLDRQLQSEMDKISVS